MSDKWKDGGSAEGLLGGVILKPLGEKRIAENTETGEKKTVFVAPGQTFGEAVAEGGLKNLNEN
jgi:hypothetical protein